MALLENNNNETSIAYIKNLYSKYKTNGLQYEDIIGYIGINRVEAKDVAISLLEEFEKNHETIICCPSFFLAKETLAENWNDKLILSNIVDYDYVTKLITTDGIIEYKINNYINAYRLLTSDKSPEMNYEDIVKHLVAHDYSGKFCLQRLLNPIKSCLPDLVQNQVFKDTQRTFDYGTKRKLLPSYDPNKQDKIDKAFYHSNLKNKIDKSLIQTLDQMLRIVIGEAEKMKVTEEVFKSQASKDWLAYSKNEKTTIDPQKFVGCFYDFARLDLFNDFKALFACIESKHPTLLENPHYVHFRTLYSVNFLKPEFIKIFI